MPIDREHFVIRDHCHINTNNDGDRFVGVKADSDNAVIYFPLGYQLPEKDDELRRDIKNLFQVLAVFTDKTDRVLDMDKFTAPQSVDFPIRAYLNVINYYLDHNGTYYHETEVTYKVDTRGKTNWGKTIKTQKPVFQGNSPVYLKKVVRDLRPDFNQLITKIHKYCVAESFERIGWFYTTNKPEMPDITLDKTMFISTLNEKLSSTNNDNDKQLFRSMIAMIDFIDDKTIDRQFYFGTDKFENVWEKLIDHVFGVENKQDYFPHAIWTERYGKNKNKPASALEPDSIMIYRGKYYVLDAKYYRYGVFPEYGSNSLPQSSDINKQITYGQYVQEKGAPPNSSVFNAFIMPYNRAENSFGICELFGNVAEATGNWISVSDHTKDYARIQGIVMDTRYLMKNYDGNHDSERSQLSAAIEMGLREPKES